jgi:hypothetical protein
LGKGTQAIQEETFRNVKLIEELLRAWNEHRQALSGCAKTGKKLAKAMEELGHRVEKTSITGSLSPIMKRELISSSDTETCRCCYRGMCRDHGKMGKKGGEGV